MRIKHGFFALCAVGAAAWAASQTGGGVVQQSQIAATQVDTQPWTHFPGTHATATVKAADPHDPVLAPPGAGNGGWVDEVRIDVPPGPAGSEPHISLRADHGIPDGVLGSGWALSAGSSIARRSSDGGVPGLTTSDGYFLDGQRLIKLSNQFFPINPVDTYQPETFDGSQLEYDASSNTWTMGREGWTFVFGSKTGTGANATKLLYSMFGRSIKSAFGLLSFTDANGSCSNSNTRCNTVEWLLSQVTDPNGNVLTYDYSIEAKPAGVYSAYWYTDARNHLLSQISYAGGAARIAFTYATRPDPQLSYGSGTPTFSGQRLSEIRSYALNGDEYSHYRIDYKDKNGLDCSGVAIPAADVNNLVTHPVQTLIRRIVRISAVGHPDAGVEHILRCNETNHEGAAWGAAIDLSATIPEPIGASVPENIVVPVPLQLDGDGITDLVLLGVSSGRTSSTVNHQAFIATPNGASKFTSSGDTVAKWVAMLNLELPGAVFQDRRGFAFSDVNRDGWTDLLYETVPQNGGVGSVRLARWSQNAGFFYTDTPDVDACDLRHSDLVDINGDGFPDLAERVHDAADGCPTVTGAKWLMNLGTSPWFRRGASDANWKPLSTPESAITSSVGEIVPPEFASTYSSASYLAEEARFLDANADGLADLAYALYARWTDSCDSHQHCWQVPDTSSLYSRIFLGDGYGGFIDSGLSAGGSVLGWRTNTITTGPTSRPVSPLLATIDVTRSGRPSLIATQSYGDFAPAGAYWRGIKLGFGTTSVGAAQAAGDLDAQFWPPALQPPGQGDSCYEVSSWFAMGDFDGDGFDDVLSFNLNETPLAGCSGQWCVTLYKSTRDTAEGRITQSDGSWGGRTKLTWGTSATGDNQSTDFPSNVEVLTHLEDADGASDLHYAHPTQSQARFRGFGLVERKNARGGIDQLAFATSPALQGKLLYAARRRTDGTLERVTVNAWGAPPTDDGFCHVINTDGTCATPFDPTAAYGASDSSWSIDLSAPYFNGILRTCEYDVERSAVGVGPTLTVPDLIEHCYRWNGKVAPSHDQLLAAAGLYRYPHLGTAGYFVQQMVWQDEDRLGDTWPSSLTLSDAVEPWGPQTADWSFDPGLAFTAEVIPIASRWAVPAGTPIPAAATASDLSHTDAAALGGGFSAFVIDTSYDNSSHLPVDRMAYRDVLTDADDLHSVLAWESPPTPAWAHRGGPWRRHTSTTVSDSGGAVLSTDTRSSFATGHFDLPQQRVLCGANGHGCDQESFGYFANGELSSHTLADGSQETFLESPWCQAMTVTDPVGRQTSLTFDTRCRLTRKSQLGVVTLLTYDGQNRVKERTVTPTGSPGVTITSTIDDSFSNREDRLFAEPRLMELRPSDNQLALTYLDGFGRPTRHVVCKNASSVATPSCQAGTSLVTDWTLYGDDGQVWAAAHKYFSDGGHAETPALTVFGRDGYGRPVWTRTPANIDLAGGGAADWRTTKTSYAPLRIIRVAPNGRATREYRDTLSADTQVDGTVVAHTDFNALEQPTQDVGRDGIAITFAYRDDHRLTSATRAGTVSTVDSSGTLSAQAWAESYKYDALGRRTRTTHADGTGDEVIYDSVGRALELAHLDGAGLRKVVGTFSYTGGTVDTVTFVDETGRSVVQTYDGEERPLSRDDGLGTTTTWTYDASGKADTITYADAALTLVNQYTHDYLGRVTKQVTPERGTDRFDYDGAGDRTQLIDEAGVTTTWSHFFSGRPFETRLLTSGGSWLLERQSYDALGRLTTLRRGGVTEALTYDSFDRVTRREVGSPLAYADDYSYDGSSDRVVDDDRTAVGIAGTANRHNSYDGWGRLATARDPDLDLTTFEYDLGDRPRFRIDPEGFAQETRYDSRGRVSYQRALGADSVSIGYDPAASYVYLSGAGTISDAMRIDRTDAAGNLTRTYLRPDGATIAIKQADGSRRERVFVGARPSDEYLIDASGAAVSRTTIGYDANGRATGEYGPALPSSFATPFVASAFTGYAVTQKLTRAGRQSWIDAAGERTTFDYDATDGLLTAEHYRGFDRTLVRHFDALDPDVFPFVDGDSLARHSGGGTRTSSFTRDSAGRTLTTTYTDPSGSSEVRTRDQLDFWGHPRRELSQLGGVTQVKHDWTYSTAGRPMRRDTRILGGAVQTTKWSWFKNGVRHTVTGPSGNGLSYDYGLPFDHELDKVNTLTGTLVSQVTARDARGLPTAITLATGRVAQTYDPFGRVAGRQRYDAAGNLELAWTPQYDAFGRIARQDFADATRTWSDVFGYDPAGHLTSEARQRWGLPLETLTYTVNGAGYRTATTGTLDGVDQTMATTYDPAFALERLTSVTSGGATTSIGYDDWDDVTTDQHSNHLSYLPSGELRTLTDAAGVLRTYYRDARGIPFGSDEPGGRRNSIWDLEEDGRPVEITGALPGSGYASAEGMLLERIDASGTFRDQGDGPTGSLMLDAGLALDRGSVFGVGLGSSDRFAYAGLETVASAQLGLARHRVYDPQTGRFGSPDPLGLGGGHHRTLYASGDPADRSDALGLSDCSPTLPVLGGAIGRMPPAYVQGATGGPASPFGPGVAVVYVDELAIYKPFEAPPHPSSPKSPTSKTDGSTNPADDSDPGAGSNVDGASDATSDYTGYDDDGLTDVEMPTQKPAPPTTGKPTTNPGTETPSPTTSSSSEGATPVNTPEYPPPPAPAGPPDPSWRGQQNRYVDARSPGDSLNEVINDLLDPLHLGGTPAPPIAAPPIPNHGPEHLVFTGDKQSNAPAGKPAGGLSHEQAEEDERFYEKWFHAMDPRIHDNHLPFMLPPIELGEEVAVEVGEEIGLELGEEIGPSTVEELETTAVEEAAPVADSAAPAAAPAAATPAAPAAAPAPTSSMSGPVELYPPKGGATAEELRQLDEYCASCNRAIANNEMSPTGRVSTKGTLRDQASSAAARERARAAAAGTPYKGVAGHGPDTTWTGKPNPPEWLDLTNRLNTSLGGQTNGYPIGYVPTHFVVVIPP